jgi:hypothetical protein
MDGGRECALKELKGYADSVGMQIITTPPDNLRTLETLEGGSVAGLSYNVGGLIPTNHEGLGWTP